MKAEATTATKTTFRVVVQSQIHENYGTHNCECSSIESCTCEPYWKAKGGSEYHRTIGTVDDVLALGAAGIQAVVNDIRSKFERHDRFYNEDMIDWSLIPSTEETYDERMYREMREEGWWPKEHSDEIYAERLAALQV